MENKQIIEKQIKCESCSDKINESEAVHVILYSNAFDQIGFPYDFCCDICEDSYLEESFICDECGRRISKVYKNTMHYRIVNKDEICLKCYEKRLYEEGITKKQLEEDLDKGSLSGMFFDDGDLESEGFIEVESTFVHGSYYAKEITKKCLEIADNNHLVIIEFKHLSRMLNEDISLFGKRRKKIKTR